MKMNNIEPEHANREKLELDHWYCKIIEVLDMRFVGLFSVLFGKIQIQTFKSSWFETNYYILQVVIAKNIKSMDLEIQMDCQKMFLYLKPWKLGKAIRVYLKFFRIPFQQKSSLPYLLHRMSEN